jgi:hypothetical protein
MRDVASPERHVPVMARRHHHCGTRAATHSLAGCFQSYLLTCWPARAEVGCEFAPTANSSLLAAAASSDVPRMRDVAAATGEDDGCPKHGAGTDPEPRRDSGGPGRGGAGGMLPLRGSSDAEGARAPC